MPLPLNVNNEWKQLFSFVFSWKPIDKMGSRFHIMVSWVSHQRYQLLFNPDSRAYWADPELTDLSGSRYCNLLRQIIAMVCHLFADSRFAPSQWEMVLLCNDVSHWLVVCHMFADSRFAPSQWETVLLCNNISRWLGTSLESALHLFAGNMTSIQSCFWIPGFGCSSVLFGNAYMGHMDRGHHFA